MGWEGPGKKGAFEVKAIAWQGVNLFDSKSSTFTASTVRADEFQKVGLMAVRTSTDWGALKIYIGGLWDPCILHTGEKGPDLFNEGPMHFSYGKTW